MHRTMMALALVSISAVALAQDAAPPAGQNKPEAKPAADQAAPAAQTALDFTMKNIDGKDVSLAQYRGKVVLIVNVASQCGMTPQYEGLVALHNRYEKDGLVVLGFPCNQFGGQEPGTEKEIKEFCTGKYDVKFPMFSKVDVNGDNACGLYKHLTGKDTNEKFAGPIKWNFTKFLIDRDGRVIARFEPRVRPESAEVTGAIEAALKASGGEKK